MCLFEASLLEYPGYSYSWFYYIVPLLILLHCSIIYFITLFHYLFYYIVPLFTLLHCSIIYFITLFHYWFYYIVPLFILLHCSIIDLITLFHYWFYYIVSLFILLHCSIIYFITLFQYWFYYIVLVSMMQLGLLIEWLAPWPSGLAHSLLTVYCLYCTGSIINPVTLRVPIESIVCYFYTFENNLRIKGMFAKYLKESCFVASD